MEEHYLEKLGIRTPDNVADKRLVLILGPCVIEDAESTYDMAGKIVKITDELEVPFVFKASYDKANRTSVDSFRGPGVKEGLAILYNIKEDFKIPVLSDVHSVSEIEQASRVLDIIQIPAFLSRQTDLLVESGRTGKIINIKKGQFMSPWDMRYAVNKVQSTGNDKVMITERGTSFGYNNLVVDMRGLHVMSEYAPVIFDATHSVQRPGGLGGMSDGNREFIPALARAAIAAGAKGLFMEVHTKPEKALSDGKNMFPIDKLKDFLQEMIDLFEHVGNMKRWDL